MTRLRRHAVLLLATSAIAAPGSANTVLFSTGTTATGRIQSGTPPQGTVNVRGGVTQVMTPDGDVVSLMGDGSFDASGAIVTVSDGRVTVSAGSDGRADISVGSTVSASVTGLGATASFSLTGGGITAGRVLGGTVSVTAGGVTRNFDLGQAFAATAGQVPRPIATPGAAPIQSAAMTLEADQSPTGPIEFATSPFAATVPSGSAITRFEALAGLRGTFGGFAFPTVSPAFFDVNLASVRAGQGLGAFRADAGAQVTAAYLAALRNGTPASQAALNPAYQAALFSYFGSDGLPTGTSQSTRDLLSAYQAIIAAGGAAAGFSSGATVEALAEYARFLASGGSPTAFGGASAALLAAYNQAFAQLGAGNAQASLLAQIEAQRQLTAALGANANLSTAFATQVVDAYLASLATAKLQLSGLTEAQIRAYFQYLGTFGIAASADAVARQRIADYQVFVSNGGSFGTPQISRLDAARQLAELVSVRRQGQTASFAQVGNADRLSTLVETFRTGGIPEGLTAAERERVETALAFFNGGGGGVFETPGRPFADASFTSGFTTGTYAMASARPTESSRLSITGVEAQALTFDANGRPVAGGWPSGFRFAPMEGRSGPGYLIGRFGATPISTNGHSIAIVRPYMGAIPTSGTATYNLLAYTTPQYADERLVSAATLTGQVRLNFGSGLSFQTRGTVSVTDPNATRAYMFDTGTGSNAVTATGADLCPTATSCSVSTFNLLGGTAGEHVAGSWLITQTNSIATPVLGGAWVFGGTLVATPPPPPVGITRVAAVSGVVSSFTSGNYVGARGFSGGHRGFDRQAIVFDAQGQPRTSVPFWEINPTSVGSQHAKQDNWLMARFVRASGQHELDVVTMRPATVAIPTTGRAEFQFFSNLDIVRYQSTLAYTGTLLDGRIAITFGTAPRFGIDAALQLTQSGGTVDTYRFGNAAAFTSPNGSAIFTASTNSLRTDTPSFSVTGPDCGSGCFGELSFALGGPNADLFGGTFRVLGQGGLTQLFGGSAMAQQVATGSTIAPTVTAGRVTPAPTPTPTPTPTPIPPPTGSTRVAVANGVESSFATGNYVGAQGFAAGFSSFAVREVGFSTQGQPRRSSGLWDFPSSVVGGQHAKQSDWLMARFLRATGGHERDIVVMRPLTVQIPTSGRAEFQFISNLDIVSGRAVSYNSTLLDGRLAISFGSAPTFGIDAALRLSQIDGTIDIYRFGSAERFTTPNGTTIYNRINDELRTSSTGFEVVGPDCGTGCTGGLSFALGGASGDLFGGTFQVTSGANTLFFGSAIARQVATGSTVAPTGLAGRVAPAVVAPTPPLTSAFAVIRPEGQSSTQATLQTAGGILTAFGLNLPDGATSTTRRGTASVEGGSSPTQIVGWTRWFGGRATIEASTGGTGNDDITASGGRHFVWGTRATNLPTSGSANFDMVGATRVTTTDDRPLGTVDSATLRVAFASTPLVGVDIGVTVAGQSYTVSNFGGIATPNMQVATTSMEFGGDATVTGNGCTASTCSGVIRGFLAGDTASHAGVAFSFPLAPGRSASANAAVGFARRP